MRGLAILDERAEPRLALVFSSGCSAPETSSDLAALLLMAETDGPGWARALWWNIVPADLDNIVGASVLVALPFWFVFRPSAAD